MEQNEITSNGIGVMKEEEDRISLLPDCLLIDIISLLPETKYAIRTGTLSRRWQHLWLQLPNLFFWYFGDDFPQFYSSVERIISQRGQSNLNKFQLYAHCNNQTRSQVNDCIRNAINHNVQEVDFDVYKYSSHCEDICWFYLPKFFFISSSFIHLKLSRCTFKKAYVVSWENLRTLHIEDAKLDQDSIKNILSGSPLLETLKLYYCNGFERLDITNKSVKNLVLFVHSSDMVEIIAPCILSLVVKGLKIDQDVVSWENLRTLYIEDAKLDQDSIKNILSGSPLLETLELAFCNGFERIDITNKSVKNLVYSGCENALCTYSVEINAPYILSLTIQEPLRLKKLLLLNMSSVIKAELDYYPYLKGEEEDDEVNEEMLKGLLLSLGHVKEVKIGKLCLKALTCLKAKGFIYPSNLKVLGEIDSSRSGDCKELLLDHGPKGDEVC